MQSTETTLLLMISTRMRIWSDCSYVQNLKFSFYITFNNTLIYHPLLFCRRTGCFSSVFSMKSLLIHTDYKSMVHSRIWLSDLNGHLENQTEHHCLYSHDQNQKSLIYKCVIKLLLLVRRYSNSTELFTERIFEIISKKNAVRILKICRKSFRFNFAHFSSLPKVISGTVICSFHHYRLVFIFIFVGQRRQVINGEFAWECRGPSPCVTWGFWYSLNWSYATQLFIFSKLLDHWGLFLNKSKSWHTSSCCSDFITVKVRNSFHNGCCIAGTDWLPASPISYFGDGSLLNDRNSLNLFFAAFTLREWI